MINAGIKVQSTISNETDFFPSEVFVFHEGGWYHADPYVFINGEWKMAFFGQPKYDRFITSEGHDLQVRETTGSTVYDNFFVLEE